MSNISNEKRTAQATLSFAAIDPYIQEQISVPTERKMHGRDVITWGERNDYPDYILGLVENVPTLDSVIAGCVDYIVGDAQALAVRIGDLDAGIMNTSGDTIRMQAEDVARDLETFGGFALQVIRGNGGGIAGIYHLPMQFVRTNKDCTVFYYSEEWTKRSEVVVYPAFIADLGEKWATLTDEERDRNASSVFYYKSRRGRVYPRPPFAAAVRGCEMEKNIDIFHLSALENGFTSSAIVNFNNGVPADEVKEEIEGDFNEKFSGSSNAGRIGFSWNKNKDSATTIEEFKVEDFGEKYNSLAKRARQEIFTSFRANPNLFGIPTESLGFSSEEYKSSFRLFNRTVVRPAQRAICDAYDAILGEHGVLTITPFSLDRVGEQNVN